MIPTWVRRPDTGPAVVHVTATSTTGGVAELLHGLIPGQVEAGMAVGWAVIAGDTRFFEFTRYLSGLLHGWTTSDTPVTLADAMPRYRATLDPQARRLARHLVAGDVVVLHDPDTLGMAPALARRGVRVVWHCHTGSTDALATGPEAVWHALRGELDSVDAVVSTLPEFAPPAVPAARRFVAAPAIDPCSPKNRPLSPDDVQRLLGGAGLTADVAEGIVVQDQPLPADAPVLLQVSRWDPIKDMPGVLRCVPQLRRDVHVVLAGYDPASTPEEPHAPGVLDDVCTARANLPERDRRRVHIVLPSAAGGERSALVVNALQRRADVVLQKSLAEGFGLTMTEAMAKGKAAIASDVGGLRQQISPGYNGILVYPGQTDALVDALDLLFQDPLLRRRLGRNATESVSRRYLMPRLVADYGAFAMPGRPAEERAAA